MFARVIPTFSVIQNLIDAHVEDLARLDPDNINNDSDDEQEYGSEWLTVSAATHQSNSKTSISVNALVYNNGVDGSEEDSEASIVQLGKRKNGPSQRRCRLKAARAMEIKSDGETFIIPCKYSHADLLHRNGIWCIHSK
jgi:hypothetical protein